MSGTGGVGWEGDSHIACGNRKTQLHEPRGGGTVGTETSFQFPSALLIILVETPK